MYYELVLRTLNRNKVKYIIAGGMAVNLYGIPRFTKDLDLVINQSLKNLSALARALKKLGFKPKVPIKTEIFLDPKNWPMWRKEKRMLALNFYNPRRPFEEIDLLVYAPISFEKANRRKTRMAVGDINLNVVSLRDLISMKKKAGREQDRADIKSIQKLMMAMRKK